jgi:hypothetical protein
MFSFLRALIICTLFFFFLSITVNGTPIFNHIYAFSSHLTVPVQKLTSSIFSKAADSTTQYSKKLFDNSVPKLKDSVKSKSSAPSRWKSGGEPEEVIRNDEKKELEDLIKRH